ncbi:IclR family transcriptional regulator [Spelaeicoccus albus]|uniref:DNA-binding IclR family transcriptional regulator n=1 Tax=Spelaeicoccus albus TaxID=1280376 RepID=A0A7Z0ACB5_9MICO|nr:IclR family transcriptional regulator [Spelaeicoccus albus]NYI67310.1 DNA-binding IclR family transcriptional regulator [Spelaeicoccus albus]
MSQSVRRAARIVDSIAAEPKTVVQLATEFDLHRSTMFRELQSLEEVGYVRRRHDGTYSLGLHLAALAQASLDSIDLREAGTEHARRLQQAVGNTVHIAALMESAIIYAVKIEDAGGTRMYSSVGARVHPNCSGAGKAILAGLDDRQRDAVLQTATWTKYTDSTITTRAELDAALVDVARQGWAADDGEFEDFVNCVAVPIHSSVGVVGALSLTAIRMREDLDQLKTRIPLMQQTAARISRELG